MLLIYRLLILVSGSFLGRITCHTSGLGCTQGHRATLLPFLKTNHFCPNTTCSHAVSRSYTVSNITDINFFQCGSYTLRVKKIQNTFFPLRNHHDNIKCLVMLFCFYYLLCLFTSGKVQIQHCNFTKTWKSESAAQTIKTKGGRGSWVLPAAWTCFQSVLSSSASCWSPVPPCGGSCQGGGPGMLWCASCHGFLVARGRTGSDPWVWSSHWGKCLLLCFPRPCLLWPASGLALGNLWSPKLWPSTVRQPCSPLSFWSESLAALGGMFTQPHMNHHWCCCTTNLIVGCAKFDYA